MPSVFVSLHEFVAPQISVDSEHTCDETRAGDEVPHEPIPALRAFVREINVARAALADALDVARYDLLRDLAADVLVRELLIEPADLRAIVARALDRAKADIPVAVRVHPDELAALASFDVPTIADPQLRRGDVMLVVQRGTIDVSLGVRLAVVLESYA